MKQLLGTDVSGSYTFNASAKTVTFYGLTQTITLSNILLITNVTANTIIYNFADPTTGAASFTNNVLTLDYDTSVSMNSSDVLQIFLDIESKDESLHDLLRRMNKLLESNAVVDSQLRQRITLDSIGPSTAITTTVPVSGTVTATVGNLVATQLVSTSAANPYTVASSSTGLIMEGPVHQMWRIVDDARNCYASAIRSKLSFS
jgi:hypothetical protein